MFCPKFTNGAVARDEFQHLGLQGSIQQLSPTTLPLTGGGPRPRVRSKFCLWVTCIGEATSLTTCASVEDLESKGWGERRRTGLFPEPPKGGIDVRLREHPLGS